MATTFSKSKIETLLPFGVMPPPKAIKGGLPLGGVTAEKLVKKSDKAFDAQWVPDTDAVTGPAGPAGQPGASGDAELVQWTAGQVMGSPRVIMLDAGLAKLFTQVEAAIGLPVAVSSNSVLIGETVDAVITGELQSAGSFVSGQIYFAGPSGSLVTTPPATGVVLRIGAARTNDILVVQFGDPVAQV